MGIIKKKINESSIIIKIDHIITNLIITNDGKKIIIS